MKRNDFVLNSKRIVFACLAFLLAVPLLQGSAAHADGNMPPANDPLYKEECGSCHNLFLPGLLPGRSWQLIMNGLDKHFGEDASIEPEDTRLLTEYLSANAADTIRSERSRKIMRSLSPGDAPLRITEIPYIKRKHRELNPQIFKREGIRTFSNCFSCHPEGNRGNFEEDFVVIPGSMRGNRPDSSFGGYGRSRDRDDRSYRGGGYRDRDDDHGSNRSYNRGGWNYSQSYGGYGDRDDDHGSNRSYR